MNIVNVMKISQVGSKSIYIGKVDFMTIQKNVILTKRVENSGDFFQRKTDQGRINEIAKYLLNLENKHDSVIPFPTPLVLSLDVSLNEKPLDLDAYIYEKDAEPILIDENKLILPKNYEYKILIVDGQHRFKGVEKYLQLSENKNFEFFVTFLLNYDLYEQATVFANINFKQRPVNKSLYYDIFGSLPDVRNELTFAHYLAKSLNQNEALKGIIKMLGSGPGTVSLAFFVETIINELISYKGNLYNIYSYYLENSDSVEKQSFKMIPTAMNDYFLFIKENFTDFFPVMKDDNTYSSYEYKYYMMKAPGIYSLLRIFNDIFPSVDLINYSKNDLYNLLNKVFVKILKDPIKFFDNELFKKTGSAALQKKLYQFIYEELNLN